MTCLVCIEKKKIENVIVNPLYDRVRARVVEIVVVARFASMLVYAFPSPS